MHKAIEYWQDYQPQRPHIAILGDMLSWEEMSEDIIRYRRHPHGNAAQTLITGANSLHYHPATPAKRHCILQMWSSKSRPGRY